MPKTHTRIIPGITTIDYGYIPLADIVKIDTLGHESTPHPDNVPDLAPVTGDVTPRTVIQVEQSYYASAGVQCGVGIWEYVGNLRVGTNPARYVHYDPRYDPVPVSYDPVPGPDYASAPTSDQRAL